MRRRELTLLPAQRLPLPAPAGGKGDKANIASVLCELNGKFLGFSWHSEFIEVKKPMLKYKSIFLKKQKKP
jgi:hypothetical protein